MMIFVVDDEPTLHEVYRDMFEFAGHCVIADAYNGVEAVDLFTKMGTKPDIIIMDHRMPRKDGIEATREILRLDPGARIIFASADVSVREEALSVGAIGFKSKPFDINDILADVENSTRA